MSNALSSDKVEKLNSPIKENQVVGLRLDIPAYLNKNTWVVSVHDGPKVSGKAISYRNAGRITDVNFSVTPIAALNIAEGKPKQAKGNAIERLGKNVIGFRKAFMKESLFPFICFGDGCDFSDDSTIIDRVVNISMFSKLNVIRVHNEGEGKNFNRGSFFFREKEWTATEMAEEMSKIAESSIYY